MGAGNGRVPSVPLPTADPVCAAEIRAGGGGRTRRLGTDSSKRHLQPAHRAPWHRASGHRAAQQAAATPPWHCPACPDPAMGCSQHIHCLTALPHLPRHCQAYGGTTTLAMALPPLPQPRYACQGPVTPGMVLSPLLWRSHFAKALPRLPWHCHVRCRPAVFAKTLPQLPRLTTIFAMALPLLPQPCRSCQTPTTCARPLPHVPRVAASAGQSPSGAPKLSPVRWLRFGVPR